MKSGSWSSYQAALPPEARAGGEPDEDLHGPECPRCGCELLWEECEYCGGEGFDGHDCGEDTCVCLDPVDNIVCGICEGLGGWWECPCCDHEEDPEEEA